MSKRSFQKQKLKLSRREQWRGQNKQSGGGAKMADDKPRGETEQSIRDAIMKKMAEEYTVSFNGQIYGVASSPGMIARVVFDESRPQPELTKEQKLERELNETRTKLERQERINQQQDSVLKQLAEAPKFIGAVIAVDDKGQGVVGFNGGVVEVGIPEGIKPGDVVRMTTQTQQILGKLESKYRAGNVLQVIKVREETLVVDASGSNRVIERGRIELVEPGWSVTVDQSGSVALFAHPPDISADEAAPTVYWDDIGGLHDAKEAIREAIEYPILYADMYHQYGKKPSKGVLLYGPPGTGKTMLGKATATAIQGHHGRGGGFIYIKGPEILSKWVGDSENNVRRLFDRCREYKRKTGYSAVLFIDEADALLAARGGGHGLGGISNTVVPAFLAEMDGIGESAAFVMLATNRPDVLDSAVTRDGRIDRRVHVGRPGRSEVSKILSIHLRGKPLGEDGLTDHTLARIYSDASTVVRDQFVRVSLDMDKGIHAEKPQTVTLSLGELITGAVIAGIVGRATEAAIKRDRASGNVTGIRCEDIDLAIETVCHEMSGTDLRQDLLHKAQHQHVATMNQAEVN